MVKKIDQIREMIANNKWHSALRMAASFQRLGKYKVVITKAWAAKSNPGFYRQLGQDPEKLVSQGVSALREKYNG